MIDTITFPPWSAFALQIFPRSDLIGGWLVESRGKAELPEAESGVIEREARESSETQENQRGELEW